MNARFEADLQTQARTLPSRTHLSNAHLDALEEEAIFILREVAAAFERPALLFSGGKDSLVLLKQFKATPTAPNGLRVNYVWPLLFDGQGTLWIGTIGGGLHQLTTDAQGRQASAQRTTESDPPPPPAV